MSRQFSILKYILLISTHLKWASDYLLHQSFYSSRLDLPGIVIAELGIRRYQYPAGAAEAAECAICLCKIEEGDEVRELRCNHLFHRVCLDRWVGHGRITCPLCRNHLSLPTVDAQVNQEMLLFKFCSSKSTERDRWWIR